MPKHIKKQLRPNQSLVVVFVILFTMIATVLFLMPSSSIPSTNLKFPFELDKLVHTVIHFVLAFCWLFYYSMRSSRIRFSKVLYITLACMLYGILIEVLQGTTKTRSADFVDVCANMIGTGLGVLTFVAIKFKVLTKT